MATKKKPLPKAQKIGQTGKPIQVVSIENGKRTYGTPAVDSVGYNNFVKEQQEKGQKKGTLGKIKGMFGLKKGGSVKSKSKKK